MRVAAVRGSDFRCYERVAVELPTGLVGLVGPNGAGKTALIEMIHFGCLGYSPRTTSEGQVVRFGAELLRVETDVLLSSGPVSVEIGFNPDFLRDGVESVEGDTVRLKLISSLRPGLLQGEDGSFWYLIMPIRLPS